MASIPGLTLEALVTDLWLQGTPKLEAATVAALEPHRDDIEQMLASYDEESQSWRDYRNSMMEPYAAVLRSVWLAYTADEVT